MTACDLEKSFIFEKKTAYAFPFIGTDKGVNTFYVFLMNES